MTIDCQEHIFSSGLTLLTAPMPGARSFTALVLLGVGSRYENKTNNGLSHFLEHMVFKGTDKYPSSRVIAAAVDSIGAEFNAFTGKEYTGFYIKAASQHTEFVLSMLSQLVCHPLIPDGELDKERGVIIEEINMYEDNPMAKVGQVFEGLLYGNTPLGWETIGRKQNILSLKKKDFSRYMDKWYRPFNMVVGLAGAVDRVKTKGLVSHYFDRPVKAKPKIGLPESMSVLPVQTKPRLDLFAKKTEQTHLCLGVRTFARGHKMRYALALLGTILGGNMSSRLFTEVREKRGLAYYVRTSNQHYLDNGYLVTQAGTDIKKAYDTVKIIKEQYRKIASANHGLTAKELAKAKEYLKGKLVLALEDPKEMVELLVEDQLMEGKTRIPGEILTAIDKVGLDEVLAVAKQVLRPENLNLALIGPYQNSDRVKFAKIINC